MYRYSWAHPKTISRPDKNDDLLTSWLQVICGCNSLISEGFNSEIFSFVSRAAAEAKKLERIIKLHTSQERSKAASNRHAATNSAKKYVQLQWAHQQLAYKNNKSEFARTYVALIANQFQDAKGDPLKVTEKTIKEVWLKDTLSAGTQAALPVVG